MPQNILITGASRGLGAALASASAEPGTRLILWARDRTALEKVEALCTEKGAEVDLVCADLRDTAAAISRLKALDAAHPLDAIYINAGLFDGAREPGGMERIAAELAIIEVNLSASIALIHAAATCMRGRRKGRIIVISSLAAHYPLADAAAYSASKAGLSAYAGALREKLAADNVLVTDVRPGHIMSDMTRAQKGDLPGLMSAQKAAEIILKGVRQNRSQIAFPLVLVILTRLANLLPWRLRAFLGRSQRFTIRRD
ncbi:MAG: SDR family NAD(P)-dependent oxidoreductase [Rhizobiales bacterium]|nr:SDR family NAD(P)-dependent oxidoreductase [Hyphomicrobiales bacterium]